MSEQPSQPEPGPEPAQGTPKPKPRPGRKGKPYDPMTAVRNILREHHGTAVVIIPDKDEQDEEAVTVLYIGNHAHGFGMLCKAYEAKNE